MAIQIMAAILAREAYRDEKGRFHIIDPVCSISIPSPLREQLRASGEETIKAQLPDCVAVLTLWGGQQGEKYNLSAGLTYPDGSSTVLPPQHFTWGAEGTTTLTIEMKGELGFKKSGIYKIKLLLNGRPAGQLPLPVFWEDDLPL